MKDVKENSVHWTDWDGTRECLGFVSWTRECLGMSWKKHHPGFC